MDLVISGIALSFSWCPTLKHIEDNLFQRIEKTPEKFEGPGEVILRALGDAKASKTDEIGWICDSGDSFIDHLPLLEKHYNLKQGLNPNYSSFREHLDIVNDWIHKDSRRLAIIFITSEKGSAAITLAHPNQSPSGYVRLKSTDAEASNPSRADLVEFTPVGNLTGNGLIEQLIDIFKNRSEDYPVSIGSHTLPGSGSEPLISLIHAALSVYHKVIPISSKEQKEALAGIVKDPLYLNFENRPWLSRRDHFTRSALFACQEQGSNGWDKFILQELENQTVPLSIRTITNIDPDLFLIPGSDQADLLSNLEELKIRISGPKSLESIGKYTYTKYISRKTAYTCCLLGKTRQELLKEITHAETGINETFRSGKPWSSPHGSYFTAQPLGSEGLAFVYPGAFNSYPGMGKGLFYSFPGLHDTAEKIIPNQSRSLAEEFLYLTLSKSESTVDNKQIAADIFNHPNELIESGISISVMQTLILDQLFDVRPDAALGYSLGESSMLWANGIWHNAQDSSDIWKTSTLFKSELVGEMNVIRDYWGNYDLAEDFWKSYILKASRDDVIKACESEDLVFMTIENTPTEVVIAGEQNACQRVIKTLDCHALPMPFNASIHNPAMQSTIPDFIKLYTNDTNPREEIDFYSAADYKKLTLTAGAIAESMANMTCRSVDFPRLVEQVYQDGARIFVEVGPQKTCSRWIEKILDGKPHAVIPINKRYQSDYHGFLKVISLLVSHGVNINLQALYSDSQSPGSFEIKGLERKMEGQADTPIPSKNDSPDNPPDDQNGKSANLPLDSVYFEHLDRVSADMAQSHQEYLNSQQTLTRNLARVIQMQAGGSSSQTPERSGSSVLYSRDMIQAFTRGDHRECFGSTFSGFGDRRIPRLPNGELQFMDQVMSIEGQKEQTREGSTLTSEFVLPEKSWYRNGDGSSLPHVSIMEIALQPCGFLSAYMGSIAGRETQDLYFRNLDGEGILLGWPESSGKIITNQVKLLSSSSLEDVIIQNYAFELFWGDQRFYQGTSSFGYFPLNMLENQAGLDGNQKINTWFEENPGSGEWIETSQSESSRPSALKAGLPTIDKLWISRTGGKYSQGYIYLRQTLPSDSWFYQAHFYQDPVMPGSLGVETMAQALMASSSEWDLPTDLNWRIKPGANLSWKYRGQITPDIKEIMIDIHIKKISRTNNNWEISADGQLWKESKRIYQVDNLSLETY